MSGIDSRIVTMKFDNAAFQKGAETTLSTLEKLKQSLNFGTVGAAATKGLGVISSALSRFGLKNPFQGAQQGVTDLQKSANQFQMNGLEGGITHISKSFIAMSTIAITALSNIVTSAMQAGTQIAKSLSVDPIKGGLSEYETNLNSIQTILANTKVSGANLQDVNAALDELNHYSDKTIYNFSEMARNIGTFTAAGVDLDTSVGSIKGIANLAALSGSNSQQAATAMYQLSQEIAAGRVSLMGWNSVVNAGMGGSTFQRALAETAVAMGTIDKSAVTLQGKMKNVTVDGQSFRDSIMAKPGEQSWLTSKVLTNTLRQFTGDLSDAELAAQGFSKAQIDAIKAQAKTATDAATKVKTLSGVLDTAKEVVGSGWAQTWQIVFGDFKEARKLFTNVSNTVNGFLGGMADARNGLLGGWKEMGGREKLIRGIGNAFEALIQILTPIKDAFRDIFPAKTSEDLIGMTKSFVRFTKSLQISEETGEKLRSIFGGVFAIFSIVGQVIGAIVGQFTRLAGAASENSGGFLGFLATIGELIKSFDAFLEKSGILETFFTGLGNIVAFPMQILSGFADLIGGMFDGFNTGSADKLNGAIGNFADKTSVLESAANRVMEIFSGIGAFFGRLGSTIGDALSNVGDLIATSITPETFDRTLSVINTSLLGGIVLMLRKFLTGGVSVDLTGGLLDGVKESLGAATDALQTMQANVKANIILKIAAALAILTASLVVLSMIDGKKLTKALAGVSVGFGILGAALVALSKYIALVGAAKLPLIAAAMLGIASAMLVLSLALKVLASIDFVDMLKGLGGLAGMLLILTVALKAMKTNGILRTAAALLILGVALNVMGVALKLFATLSWEEMAKGLTAVAAMLTVVAVAMRLMPKGMIKQAAAILILSGALNALGVALKIFATMSWEEMGKGLATLAGALLIIAGAMHAMPKNMLIQAVALVAVAGALDVMAVAIKVMSKMSWEEIGKGLVTLGGALLILAIGLNLMNGTLMGSAALLVAAAALTVLVPVLVALGAMSWEAIAKGLAALAGTFLVLGVAGLLMAPVIPILIALGAALVLFGAGMALVGVGVLAFATAFSIFVAAGSAGAVVMTSLIMSIINLIPEAMKAFGEGIVEFAKVIATSGPQLTKAFIEVLSSLVDSVIEITPKIAQMMNLLVQTAIQVMTNNIPRLVNAGLRMIGGILTGVRDNIYKIATVAAEIITEFLRAIGDKGPDILDEGVQTIIKFIDGVSQAIDDHSGELGAAGGRLGLAITKGMAKGMAGSAGTVAGAAVGVAKGALGSAMGFLGVNSPSKEFMKVGMYSDQGFAIGLDTYAKVVNRSAENVASGALQKMQASMSKMGDLEFGASPVIRPVLDLTQIRKDAPKIDSMLTPSPVMASVSYGQAASISVDRQAVEESREVTPPPRTVPETVKFEQNIHSPEALSTADIYRHSKNQFAQAKRALGLDDS